MVHYVRHHVRKGNLECSLVHVSITCGVLHSALHAVHCSVVECCAVQFSEVPRCAVQCSAVLSSVPCLDAIAGLTRRLSRSHGGLSYRNRSRGRGRGSERSKGRSRGRSKIRVMT